MWRELLINHETRCWHRDLIEMCFTRDEAKTILIVPLHCLGCVGKVFWHYTKHELLTVRSGCKVAQELERYGELGRNRVERVKRISCG